MKTKFQTLVIDVDGTLTDGKIIYDNNNNESKNFNVKDGVAIKKLLLIGVRVIIMTGRNSKSTEIRAKELGVNHLYQNVANKKEKLFELSENLVFSLEGTLYIGDDVNDLNSMKSSGFKACPANSAVEILEIADYISPYEGGDGAVRNILDRIFNINYQE